MEAATLAMVCGGEQSCGPLLYENSYSSAELVIEWDVAYSNTLINHKLHNDHGSNQLEMLKT